MCRKRETEQDPKAGKQTVTHTQRQSKSWQAPSPRIAQPELARQAPPQDSEQTRAIGIARHTTTRTRTSIHPEADRRKDRQTQYVQAGATPPSPMMAKGLHPKDLLAHAEPPPPRAVTRTRYTHPHLPIQADTHINMCVCVYIYV